jgi:hypothetical protein
VFFVHVFFDLFTGDQTVHDLKLYMQPPHVFLLLNSLRPQFGHVFLRSAPGPRCEPLGLVPPLAEGGAAINLHRLRLHVVVVVVLVFFIRG